jgi:hypothetical protein
MRECGKRMLVWGKFYVYIGLLIDLLGEIDWYY